MRITTVRVKFRSSYLAAEHFALTEPPCPSGQQAPFACCAAHACMPRPLLLGLVLTCAACN
jgi:hypothetical protein